VHGVAAANDQQVWVLSTKYVFFECQNQQKRLKSSKTKRNGKITKLLKQVKKILVMIKPKINQLIKSNPNLSKLYNDLELIGYTIKGHRKS